jgi:LCP family protein required for cell wall assembly
MKHDHSEHSTRPAPQTTEKPVTAAQLLFKSTLLALVIASGMLLVTAIGVLLFVYSKFTVFLSTAGLSTGEVKSFIDQGIQTSIPVQDNVTTFLLLGIDSVENKVGAPPLTDSMLLVSLDHRDGSVRTVAMPRDLWSEEYKTKINALYVYGKERYPNSPQQFPKEVIEEMTGIPINYTLVISLDMVASLVDTLGGVTIEVPESFTDTEFPRADVDIAKVKDPTELYETVTFEKGTEKMSGERILKYVRSRHSQGDTGTDTDRTKRQQLVIRSIADVFKQKSLWTNPQLIGQLYKWYAQHIKSVLSEQEVVAFSKLLFPYRNSITVTASEITIFPDDPQGLIEHPPVSKTDNQWVYAIKNPEDFRKKVYDMLIKPSN